MESYEPAYHGEDSPGRTQFAMQSEHDGRGRGKNCRAHQEVLMLLHFQGVWDECYFISSSYPLICDRNPGAGQGLHPS